MFPASSYHHPPSSSPFCAAAAAQDNADAQFELAACYKDGRGVEASEERALYWLRCAPPIAIVMPFANM